MKAIKCILPVILFMFIGTIGQAQVATKTAAVNTKVNETTCQKVCTPALCDKMVKLGLCTPEQAAKCQAEGKNVKTASTEINAPKATKVASVTKERTATATAAPKTKSKTCAKTCKGAKKE